MTKVKITVVKKLNSKDIFGSNPPVECTLPTECKILEVGQEFIVEGNKYPPDFCPAAFAAILKYIFLLRNGGNIASIKEKGVGLALCSDAWRPVIFKLQRIED